MTLPAGTKLGPYEILAPLGAGGMGRSSLWKDIHVPEVLRGLARLRIAPDGRTYVYAATRTFSELYAVTGLR